MSVRAGEGQGEGAADVVPCVSIIVVSYGTRDMTLECLASIVRQTHAVTYEVLVVDNASPDDSAEAMAKAFPAFRHMPQSQNLGFAAANNLAAKQARGEYLLLLNPDTVVLDGAIDKLVAFARRRPQAGVWGGRTVFSDGRLNPNSCWRQLSLWNLFCRSTGLALLFNDSALFHSEAYGGWKRDTEREVDIVTGCFLLITRDLWRRLDGFAPEFFMYGEDADLCLRAKQLGARPAIAPEAAIVHYGSATEPSESRKAKRTLAAKYLLIGKQFRPPARQLAIALLALHPALKSVLPGRNRAMWKEVWDARRTWLSGTFTAEAAKPAAK